MNAIDMITQAEDALTVKRVFGEPIHEDGVTVIPVARISGGGGGGTGESPASDGAAGGADGAARAATGSGSGGGFGLGAAPAGAFVIRDGAVSWRPAVDVNRVIRGGQLVAVAALLVLRSYLRLRARS